MNKQEFLNELRARLSDLPQEYAEESINFYSEMIDDKIDDGISEDVVVDSIGNVNAIAAQIISDFDLIKTPKSKIGSKRKLKVWEIVLIIVCAPIWASILIAAAAVVFSAYAAVWATIVALWASFGSFIAGALGAVASGIGYICHSELWDGLICIGAALTLAGISIFLFFGSNAATDGVIKLTKKIFSSIKKAFGKKEEA